MVWWLYHIVFKFSRVFDKIFKIVVKRLSDHNILWCCPVLKRAFVLFCGILPVFAPFFAVFCIFGVSCNSQRQHVFLSFRQCLFCHSERCRFLFVILTTLFLLSFWAERSAVEESHWLLFARGTVRLRSRWQGWQGDKGDSKRPHNTLCFLPPHPQLSSIFLFFHLTAGGFLPIIKTTRANTF